MESLLNKMGRLFLEASKKDEEPKSAKDKIDLQPGTTFLGKYSPPRGKAQWQGHPSAGILWDKSTPGYDPTTKTTAHLAGVKPMSFALPAGTQTPPMTSATKKKPAGVAWGKMSPTGSQGVANIVEVLRKAAPEEMKYQKDWYRHIHELVKNLADRYQVPMQVAAGITAVLSPGLNPLENIDQLEKVLSRGKLSAKGPEWEAVINAKNIAFLVKAINILAGHEVAGEVSGPKVSVFYMSILDPEKAKAQAVIDGHAFNIWRGQPVALSDVGSIPKEWLPQIKADYAEAGRQFGLTAQEAQAVSWYVWRIMIAKKPVPIEWKTSFPGYYTGAGHPEDPEIPATYNPPMWGGAPRGLKSWEALPNKKGEIKPYLDRPAVKQVAKEVEKFGALTRMKRSDEAKSLPSLLPLISEGRSILDFKKGK